MKLSKDKTNKESGEEKNKHMNIYYANLGRVEKNFMKSFPTRLITSPKLKPWPADLIIVHILNKKKHENGMTEDELLREYKSYTHYAKDPDLYNKPGEFTAALERALREGTLRSALGTVHEEQYAQKSHRETFARGREHVQKHPSALLKHKKVRITQRRPRLP